MKRKNEESEECQVKSSQVKSIKVRLFGGCSVAKVALMGILSVPPYSPPLAHSTRCLRISNDEGVWTRLLGLAEQSSHRIDVNFPIVRARARHPVPDQVIAIQ
jgi:hypothetical protein